MEKKIGRNDPCPCGSGKKYKQCCIKHPTATGAKKFKAKLLSQAPLKQAPDLMERTFGAAISSSTSTEKPPMPSANFTAFDPKQEKKEEKD